MNHDDRKFLGELKANVKNIFEDVREIKQDIKCLIKGHHKQKETMIGLDLQFKNHLKHHVEEAERKYRKRERKLKIIIGVGTIATAIASIIAYVLYG